MPFEKKNAGGRKHTWRGGGGLWRCCGGSMVSWLRGRLRCGCSQAAERKDFLPLPLFFFVFGISLFSFLSHCFLFSFLLFSVYSFPFSLSLVCSLSLFGLLSLSFLRFFSFSFTFSLVPVFPSLSLVPALSSPPFSGLSLSIPLGVSSFSPPFGFFSFSPSPATSVFFSIYRGRTVGDHR